MIFIRSLKASFAKSPPQIVKSRRLAVRKDEAARRKIADTDGARRRVRQLVEDNRLL